MPESTVAPLMQIQACCLRVRGATAAADAAPGLLPQLAGINRHLHRHGGNPLRLLGLLLLSHPGTWTLVGALIGGLAVAANQLILPAVALSTVSPQWEAYATLPP